MAGGSPVSYNYSFHVHCLVAKSETACITMSMVALQGNSRLLRALIHRDCWLAKMHTDIGCWSVLRHRSSAFLHHTACNQGALALALVSHPVSTVQHIMIRLQT